MSANIATASADVVKPPTLLQRLTIQFFAAAALVLIFSVATTQLDPVHQAIFALISVLVFLVCNRRPGRGMTLFLVVLSATVSLRYIVWRVTETLEFHSFAQGLLGTGLACAEAYAITVMALGYIQTAWPLERKPVALPNDVQRWPSVDIFIPTYNEDLSVVRATVLAALAIDWPPEKLQVYILDDGRRAAFRDFAASCGAGYIIRPDNKHAKAGNLNHALAQTDGEFITIFDCDHVPTRAFLQMSMGWMAQNPRLAAIQTPHHFYSPDPFQRNLAAGTRVPSEGNMFYGLVQDGNDFWDAAFFCGSCAVIRRKALEEIGGFATETVTEDAHTALRLHRAGWESAYIKLPLAAGLATERLILHIGQRVRWARGMIQILRLDNPLFGPGLKLGQRLCYFNAMAHFLFAIPRLVFLTSPLAFLLFGQNIIAASPLAIVAYALPHIFHSVATNSRIQRNWRHSFWSEIYETVLALFLVRVTIVTLLNPRRGRFNVTDKGGILDNGYFDMRAVYPNILLALILVVGLGRGLYGLLWQVNDTLTFQALLLNTIWVVLSLLIVLAALAVGRETRQLRIRARVRAKLPAVMWLPDGRAVQAVSRDLSLGGGSLIVERPEGVADDAPVHVEFTLGADTVTVPAQVLRWDGSLLQLNWQVRNVADESRIVQIVFGRADAWVDWDQYSADRPLASLWRVLVSIRGLFRPRGRILQEPELLAEIATARAARTSTATLAKQTMVLRPVAMARTAVLLALVALAPLTARAEQGRTTIRPIPQPVPQLETQAPVAATVASPAPSPTIPDQELPAPAAPSVPTRQVVLTLRQLGAQGPMTMRGTSAIQGVMFGVRSDEVVTGAQLNLAGAMSPAMLPDLSNVTVTLNEQYLGTIPVNRDQPQYSGLSLQANPVFFQESNRLNFRFTGRYTQDCNDPLSGLLWATVSDTSTLALTLARLPAQRDLSRLPLPFVDRNIKEAVVLPFVLPADPSNETLQAAAIVSSWFGQIADFRGTSFPVYSEAPAEGNAVVVGLARQLPAGLQLPPIGGPTLAVVANPSDPYGSLLVVTGRTGAEVIAAATTAAIGTRTLSGDHALVTPPTVAPRQPYDAPSWVPTDRPVKLGELVAASELQGAGYVPGTFHVPFRTAPDLYTWRRRPFQTSINFRAPPGPIIDVSASRLDVGINGMFLRSYPLASNDQTLDWLKRIIGTSVGATTRSTSVPPWMVFGQNDLQLYFDARPLHRGDCVAIPEDLHMSVDPDSTIDLSRAHRFTTLPNLAFFAGSGFPFTRLADLSETAAVVPERPTTVELSALLDLMGRLGAMTFYPVLHIAVVRPGEIETVADRDLIVLGTLQHAAGANTLLEQSPYRIDGPRISVALPDPLSDIWRIFGDRTSDDRRRIQAALSSPLSEGASAMIGTRSPWRRDRSVVALLAGTPQGVEQMVQALGDPKLVPYIQGDLALLDGGTMSSYRAGRVYTVGHLPLWLWPDWLLRDQPAQIIALMLVACGLGGIALNWMLRRRATGRLTRHTRLG